MKLPELAFRELPAAPAARAALGVGVVVMGLAIGTGELILWPHLTVKYGLGLLWLALVGIAAQYVLNQEIARHQVATGESFFTSSARIVAWSPVFWFFSAFLLYLWPGWAAALGTLLAELFGFGGSVQWSWAALALVLGLTFSGKRAYAMLEGSLKVTVPAFFILLVAISFFNLTPALLWEAVRGVFSVGYVPADVNIQTLLGAVVFAGAGGMLNLCVSLWYRDKGFGMGAYAGKIVNPVTGKSVAVSPIGAAIDTRDQTQVARFRSWMRFVRMDQGVIFTGLGFVTLFLLSVNAYAVLVPQGIVPEGLAVAITQAQVFAREWGIAGEKLFLAMASLMLFSVLWTVVDALARMVSDIANTSKEFGNTQKFFAWARRFSVHQLYYGAIAAVVVVAAVLLPLKQPLPWLVLSGVLGGFTMAIYAPLLLILNNTKLAKPLRPSTFTNIALVAVTAFFWYFSWLTIKSYW